MPPATSRKLRRALRLAGWNAVGLLAGLAVAVHWKEHLSQLPAYRAVLAESQPPTAAGHPNLLAKEQFEFTAFALRQFAERTRRDGASLLVLSEFYLNSGRLKLIAGELGITVLSLRDYAA